MLSLRSECRCLAADVCKMSKSYEWIFMILFRSSFTSLNTWFINGVSRLHVSQQTIHI